MPVKKFNISKEELLYYENLLYTRKQVAEIYKCSLGVIANHCKKYNISFRTKCKYPVNEDFFYNWSHDLAYVLGFLMADGCISYNESKHDRSIRICLNSKDIHILESIRNLISPTRPVKSRTQTTKDGKLSKRSYLNIAISKPLFDYLGMFGLVERKSGKEIVSNKIPTEYIYSYILGHFDGDGWITKRKIGGYSVGICSSSEKMIDELLEIIQFGTKCVKKQTNGNIMYTISITSKSNVLKFRDKVYLNSTLFLKRKKNIFDSIEYFNQKTKEYEKY